MAEPPRISGTHRGIVLASILVPVLLACGFVFCFDPSRHGFYPICLFHQTTGLLCPGCGASRALYHLLHGELAVAFRFNPLLMAFLPVAGWFGARFVVRTMRNRPASMSIRPIWLWTVLIVLVAFTVVRNLPGLPLVLRLPEPAASAGLRPTR